MKRDAYEEIHYSHKNKIMRYKNRKMGAGGTRVTSMSSVSI